MTAEPDGRVARDGVSVRRAVVDDLPVLATLFDAYRQFYGRAPDLKAAEAFLRARLARDESVVFLASVDGAAAGFTQLYPAFSSVSIAPTFILNDLFVVPDRRRSGVGTRLLQAAVDHARASGAVRVTLNTDIGNTTAQATYDARGWKRDRDYFVYHFALDA